jgi:hypothetical protein
MLKSRTSTTTVGLTFMFPLGGWTAITSPRLSFAMLVFQMGCRSLFRRAGSRLPWFIFQRDLQAISTTMDGSICF